MGILNLFTKKKTTISSYQDFWNWFKTREKYFFDVVKKGDEIETLFFKELNATLDNLRKGFYFVTGMFNPDTAELIVTVDGNIKDIVFAEELMAAAPQIKGWKFTALKQAMDIKDLNISMGDYLFSPQNLYFYANNEPQYPDRIDITVVYDDFKEADHKAAAQGVFIFLDNFLGELEFATTIDDVKITGPKSSTGELVPIEKLKSFIAWREKEFVEKYEGKRRDTENDKFTLMEGELQNGGPLVAVVNAALLDWDAKASHPWLLSVIATFDGRATNGMPNKVTSVLLEQVEEQLMAELKDFEGFLYVGRETAGGSRDIYFACNDFRKAAKAAEKVINNFTGRLDLTYEIYKDKYWRSFDRFVMGGSQ